MEKKSAHAAEQDRPDILMRRWAWFESQPDLDPERLVFIDETWASTKMARTHGRAPRGERLRSPVPHGHWKTTTFVAALRNSGMVAPMVLDGPINGTAFGVGEARRLLRVVKFRDGEVTLADVNEAGNLKARDADKTDPFKYISGSVSRFSREGARKVFVDPAGRVLDPGPLPW